MRVEEDAGWEKSVRGQASLTKLSFASDNRGLLELPSLMEFVLQVTLAYLLESGSRMKQVSDGDQFTCAFFSHL